MYSICLAFQKILEQETEQPMPSLSIASPRILHLHIIKDRVLVFTVYTFSCVLMPKIAQDIIYWSCVVRRWCIVRAAGHNNIYVAMETLSSKTVWFGSKCAHSLFKNMFPAAYFL